MLVLLVLLVIFFSRKWKSGAAKLACFLMLFLSVGGALILRRTPSVFMADFQRQTP